MILQCVVESMIYNESAKAIGEFLNGDVGLKKANIGLEIKVNDFTFSTGGRTYCVCNGKRFRLA